MATTLLYIAGILAVASLALVVYSGIIIWRASRQYDRDMREVHEMIESWEETVAQ